MINVFDLAKGCLPITGRVKYNQRSNKAKFTFSSDPDDDLTVTYQCKLDKGKYKSCKWLASFISYENRKANTSILYQSILMLFS